MTGSQLPKSAPQELDVVLCRGSCVVEFVFPSGIGDAACVPTADVLAESQTFVTNVCPACGSHLPLDGTVCPTHMVEGVPVVATILGPALSTEAHDG